MMSKPLNVFCSKVAKMLPMISGFLYRLRSIVAHRDHFVQRLMSVFVSVSGSRTFFLVTQLLFHRRHMHSLECAILANIMVQRLRLLQIYDTRDATLSGP